METWEQQVTKWEQDHAEDCPYDLPDQSQCYRALLHVAVYVDQLEITFADVKRQLSQEEHDTIVRGDILDDFDGLSPSEFIIAALDIESSQCVLHYLFFVGTD